MIFINKINNSNIQYLLLTLIIILLLVWSFIHEIPTENLSVGLGSSKLDIGDGQFYIKGIDFENNAYWSERYLNNITGIIKPSFLYPFVLKVVTNISGIFNYSIYSKFWNFCLILISSLCSICSLYFIDRSAFYFFGNKVSNIAKWLFIINPYIIFYSISGGITNYMVLAVSFYCYIISNSKLFNKKFGEVSILRTTLYLFIASLFISSLRPNGAIYSIIILLITLIYVYHSSDLQIFRESLIIYLIIIISLLYSFSQIYLTYSYIQVSINVFLEEGGKYFGIEREYLREFLLDNKSNLIDNLKYKIYLFLWKTGDFVSGLSDIRDTHSVFNNVSIKSPIFPFISRITTGLFYLYPLNLLSFASLIYSRNILFRSGLWILVLASFLSLIPNFFGYAFSRYLIMFYSPFLILCSNLFYTIIKPQPSNKTK